MRKIRIGSRKSKLALAQTEEVARWIRSKYKEIEVEIVTITTTGDRILDAPLAKVGGKGLFVKEIEEALLRREIDMAVHSLKDVPSELPEDLRLICYPKREDPRDALISAKAIGLAQLPANARVGTSSIRRKAQLLEVRSDLKIEPIRGNVDTRLRKLDTEGLDAIIVAMAGIKRLKIGVCNLEPFPTSVMIPAVGQGCLAIEARGDHLWLEEILSPLNDTETEIQIRAERAFLKRMGGGCQVPMGAIAEIVGQKVWLRAILLDEVGQRAIRVQKSGQLHHPERLGEDVADDILSQGGVEIIERVYNIQGR